MSSKMIVGCIKAERLHFKHLIVTFDGCG